MNMKQFLGGLEKDMQKRSLLLHPFYQMWNEGTVPKDALDDYAKQYFHFTDHFPRFVATVYGKCTDSALRRKMLGNLIEEEIGGIRKQKPHAELWMQFCLSLGIKRKDVVNSKVAAKTSALLKQFENSTAESFLEGIGCILAYEAQVSEIAKTKKQGLKKHYGITSKEGLEFFNEHMVADIKHSQVWRDILKELARSDALQKKVHRSFKKSLDAQWAFLDGIMQENAMAA